MAAVARSGMWSGGPIIEKAEAEFAAAAGVSTAIAVGSGSSALKLGLQALGIAEGEPVAVPAYCCVAIPNAVLACGARPICVDVEPQTWNMCPKAAKRALAAEPQLRVAIVVHTFGAIADIGGISSLGLDVVEDCSHAFGRFGTGALGRIAVLSLYATKLIGAGEGGMVFTAERGIAEWLVDARNYADKPAASWRRNDKMTNWAAAVARQQLRRLPSTLDRREYLAHVYYDRLAPYADLPPGSVQRIWYRYAVAVPNPDHVIERLAAQGVSVARPIEDWRSKAEQGEFLVATSAYKSLLSLPLYPSLSEAEQSNVVSALASQLNFIHG